MSYTHTAALHVTFVFRFMCFAIPLYNIKRVALGRAPVTLAAHPLAASGTQAHFFVFGWPWVAGGTRQVSRIKISRVGDTHF